MSRRISNSLPSPPLDLGPTTRTQFPKWNGGHHSALLPARHSPALGDEGPALSLPALARAAEGSLACPDGGRVIRHCLSNRNTSELEFPVTHTKQSLAQFLIATFRAFTRRSARNLLPAHRSSPAPALIAAKRGAEILEISLTRFDSATSKFLIDNFYGVIGFAFSSHSPLTTSHFFSNRHTYEKLELDLSALESATSFFLIDTKTHFVQGAAFASRAQPGDSFQVAPIRAEREAEECLFGRSWTPVYNAFKEQTPCRNWKF